MFLIPQDKKDKKNKKEKMLKKHSLLDILCRNFPQYSRQQLYAKILCGEVQSDSETCRDPKRKLPASITLYLRPKKRYVSRGGEKLHQAIRQFAPLGFEAAGAIALDAGASSGGFSDCLLQHGAKKVYAVDSGKNQLDFRLRRDPRVESFEGCRIQDFLRNFPRAIPPDFVVMDISFRSILGLLGPALSLCQQRSGIFLCKPQFEYRRYCENFGKASAEFASFDGVLEDSLAQKVFDWFCAEIHGMGIEILASCISLLRGGRGNREFLLYLRLAGQEFS